MTNTKPSVEANGLVKGEICNRNGCSGVIDDHPKEGSCSCHIHPPCSYCTTDTAFCPECHWEASEEVEPPIDPEIARKNAEHYHKQMKEWEERRQSFNRKWRGQEAITELEIIFEGHTHFSMIKKGVFPKGTENRSTIEAKVKGTFGGRFTRFTDTTFEYIAYTD